MTTRPADAHIKTLKQNDRQLIDKDANLSVETVATDGDITVGGDLYVLGNIYADIAITTQNEGTTLSTGVTTLNFVGAGVTATGSGSTTTVTIAGGGGGNSIFTPIVLLDADIILAPVLGETYIALYTVNRTVTFTAASLAGLGLTAGQCYTIPIICPGGVSILGPDPGTTASGVTVGADSSVYIAGSPAPVVVYCTGVGTYTILNGT
jgi:hypothetical protein